jgi:uncharacterized protein
MPQPPAQFAARGGLPYLGLGVGLRQPHVAQILQEQPAIDWFEVITENFLHHQGWQRHALLRIAERYPIVLHGVSLSIGSSDPLNTDYLHSLKQLASDTQARWVSDHLCWTGVAQHTTHDLLPLPLTEASLHHVVQRIGQVQDLLQRPLVLENPSSYARFSSDSMPECEFICRMAEQSQCLLLLDVNNVFVSSVNHGFDPYAYIDRLPAQAIVQIHLAGHQHHGHYVLDTHDAPVSAPVWQLYRHTLARTGAVSTLLEWDEHIPSLSALQTELQQARAHLPQPVPQRLPQPQALAAVCA